MPKLKTTFTPSILSDELAHYKISRDLEIEISPDTTILVNKYAIEMQNEIDAGWNFVSGEDRKAFYDLPEETQDEIIHLINDYKLNL